MRERPGQAFIGFKCAPEFRDAMIGAAGGAPLSEFVRTAVIAELKRLGIPVPKELAATRSRLGKGGPKKKALKRPTEAGFPPAFPFVTIEHDGADPMPQAACAQGAAFIASAMLNEQPGASTIPAKPTRSGKYPTGTEVRAQKNRKP